jgi:IS5 family transposase
LPDLLHGNEQSVYSDSAYASRKDLLHSKAAKAKDFTNQRTRRNDVVNDVLKALANTYLSRERLMAQVRP